MQVLEYEVASTTQSENETSDGTSSGTDDYILAAFAQAVADNSSASEFAILADTEESDDQSWDNDFTPADYWKCVKCKNKQNNPMYRYCEKCYQLSRLKADRWRQVFSFYEDFERQLKSAGKKFKQRLLTEQQTHPWTSEKRIAVRSFWFRSKFEFGANDLVNDRLLKDSGFSSCSSQERTPMEEKNLQFCDVSSQEIVLNVNKIENKDKNARTGSEALRANSQPVTDLPTNAGLESDRLTIGRIDKSRSEGMLELHSSDLSATLANSENNLGFCIFCLSEPKNSVFVHSNFVHLCCCYKCAIKLPSTPGFELTTFGSNCLSATPPRQDPGRRLLHLD
ncbi:conserved hypothetical protein [Culex quinquefasciatus]|uniref:RanBP2-type domain-containing protein n=1 Tax=Culex quinquefasciatus TaxID=7176 RepID=B0WXZ6_CULQU|nr:conserved hypothetical protein [Culex quinquefasciatus]|eukprot:XP_001862268.1 conserved hypothetical protein [Culex quinquefasciatus]